MSLDLESALNDMQPLEGAFSPIVSVVAGQNQAPLLLMQLAEDDLRQMIADVLLEEPGGDMKLATAYLTGSLSWNVCEPFVGLATRGLWLAGFEPNGVAVSQRFAHWEDNGERGVSAVFDLTLDKTALTFSAKPQTALFAEALETLFCPVVNNLARLSGLSQAALWRLVADSMASCFLECGMAVGNVDQAIKVTRTILKDPSTKLSNRQTDFEWVALPEAPKVGGWMRVRGGCCRFYTAPREDAEYCTTCVLRAADSRRSRYHEYLRNKEA